MKKLFAMILAAVMLLSLTACGGGSLETFEMSVIPSGVEEAAKVTVGYPNGFVKEELEWCVTLTDEKKDIAIEVFLVNDYDCYAVNQEYAKEEYFFYEEGTYGSHKGYACMIDEASGDMEVFVYLGCVAEMDDVYMSFRISSASQNLDADIEAMYRQDAVQKVLSSVVYTAPAEPVG